MLLVVVPFHRKMEVIFIGSYDYIEEISCVYVTKIGEKTRHTRTEKESSHDYTSSKMIAQRMSTE